MSTRAVLIVDDNPAVRHALRTFLERSARIRVCGEAADGAEAIEKAKELKPGLILMDLSMPVMNGVEAAWSIKKSMPESRIVIFSLFSDVMNESLAQAIGVDLVISKTEGATGLLKALQPLLTDDASTVH